MATLIAIGYPDETRAAVAGEEALRLAGDLDVEPDAIAVIMRDGQGRFEVTTSYDGRGRARWGLFWVALFGLLFFAPALGSDTGADLWALLDGAVNSGEDVEFWSQVRDLVEPGTSALFLVVDRLRSGPVLDAVTRYGGTVLLSPMSGVSRSELPKQRHDGDRTGGIPEGAWTPA